MSSSKRDGQFLGDLVSICYRLTMRQRIRALRLGTACRYGNELWAGLRWQSWVVCALTIQRLLVLGTFSSCEWTETHSTSICDNPQCEAKLQIQPSLLYSEATILSIPSVQPSLVNHCITTNQTNPPPTSLPTLPFSILTFESYEPSTYTPCTPTLTRAPPSTLIHRTSTPLPTKDNQKGNPFRPITLPRQNYGTPTPATLVL